MAEEKTHRTVHWFRKGLRLHDNDPLLHAVKTSAVLFPVYIMDVEWQREHEKFGANKTKFMLECLTDLDSNLQKMGSRLYVLNGKATVVLKKFCKE